MGQKIDRVTSCSFFILLWSSPKKMNLILDVFNFEAKHIDMLRINGKNFGDANFLVFEK
jgi:hypothetical protein